MRKNLFRPMPHVLCLAFLLMACGNKEDNPKRANAATSPSSAPAVRVLAFGDSLTAGKDLPDPDQEAYPAVLERLLKGRGVSVDVMNAGRSGDTTFDALSRLDYSLADNPDLVLVALGSNDTFQGKRLSDIEKNLETIVARVRAKGARVILCGMRTFPNLGPEYAGGYEAVFRRVAEKHRVPLVPFLLEGVAGDPSLNLADGIHPNARGHERMAQNLLPAVLKALKELKNP